MKTTIKMLSLGILGLLVVAGFTNQVQAFGRAYSSYACEINDDIVYEAKFYAPCTPNRVHAVRRYEQFCQDVNSQVGLLEAQLEECRSESLSSWTERVSNELVCNNEKWALRQEIESLEDDVCDQVNVIESGDLSTEQLAAVAALRELGGCPPRVIRHDPTDNFDRIPSYKHELKYQQSDNFYKKPFWRQR